MIRGKPWLLALLVLATCTPPPPLAPPAPAAGRVRALVDLVAQPDLAALGRQLAGRAKPERRQRAVAALTRFAARSQRRIVPLLEAGRRSGTISTWQGFAVVNRMLVVATPEGLAALAEHPAVAAVAIETELPVEALAAGAEDGPPGKTSWAVAAIGAHEAWARGFDGTGVVVGAIDSGASALHEQMAAGYRGGPRSWLDPRGREARPRDSRTGHGTGVLSCAVGRNVSGVSLGVAPGARWIACSGLPEGRYNNVLATQCADWMFRVGQPDVLIAAWLLPRAGCDRTLKPIVDAWRTAEILPVFAAGNHGPAPASDRSPANYTGLFPGDRPALAVGGLARGGALLAASSRGPGACGGRVFPLLVAPAEDLVAAFPLTPSSYLWARGTSYAAGFVAGAAAILLQAHPEASVAEIEDALLAGAVDLGPPGADDLHGYGRVDVPRALARLHGVIGSK